MVVSSKTRCITMWLPRWRIITNPFRAMMAHISDPDRIRSLPNGHLNLRYYYLV